MSRIRYGAAAKARAATAAVAVLALLCGCGTDGEREKQPTEARVERTVHGDVTVEISVTPGEVHLDRYTLLAIRVITPRGVHVSLPAIQDRVEGFVVNGVFDEEPAAQHNGDNEWTRRARLTPLLSDQYRIAPLPVVVRDPRAPTAADAWFPTRPMILTPLPPTDRPPPADIEEALAPRWIHPPFRIVAIYILGALALIGTVFGLWKAARRVRHAIEERRMSPRERALRDLSRLLSRDLVGRRLIKEFYVELTMIVRRYIEGQHAIRAPEQTTEEFLQAVSTDSRFSPVVVQKLRAFLEAADLVKFAAHQPTSDAVDRATDTAREYIQTDEAAAALPGGNAQPDHPSQQEPQ